jgi:hypothetical protein
MGRHGRPATVMNDGKESIRIQIGRQILKGSEKKKIPLGGAVFHAEYDAQAVSLDPFGNEMAGLHGLVVGDAHPRQSAVQGPIHDILDVHVAAGG